MADMTTQPSAAETLAARKLQNEIDKERRTHEKHMRLMLLAGLVVILAFLSAILPKDWGVEDLKKTFQAGCIPFATAILGYIYGNKTSDKKSDS